VEEAHRQTNRVKGSKEKGKVTGPVGDRGWGNEGDFGCTIEEDYITGGRRIIPDN